MCRKIKFRAHPNNKILNSLKLYIMKNQKFESMVLNYINGNLSDFRHTLKRLDRSKLLQFCVFCDVYYKEVIDIYEIERQYHLA